MQWITAGVAGSHIVREYVQVVHTTYRSFGSDHIAMNSGAVFVAVTDFHAVHTYDRSSPDASFVGVSIACACSTVRGGVRV